MQWLAALEPLLSGSQYFLDTHECKCISPYIINSASYISMPNALPLQVSDRYHRVSLSVNRPFISPKLSYRPLKVSRHMSNNKLLINLSHKAYSARSS